MLTDWAIHRVIVGGWIFVLPSLTPPCKGGEPEFPTVAVADSKLAKPHGRHDWQKGGELKFPPLRGIKGGNAEPLILSQDVCTQ